MANMEIGICTILVLLTYLLFFGLHIIDEGHVGVYYRGGAL